MMASNAVVQTITGPRSVADFGLSLPHEHIISRQELVSMHFPHAFDDEKDLASAVAQVNAAMRAGVKTIFDPTVMGIGRNIPFVKQVADRTGLNIVVATGAYTFTDLPTTFRGKAADVLADLFVHDIVTGIGDTGVCAGFIKVATDKPGVTPDVDKALRAAARAHLRTGVPIMTHASVSNQAGLAQLDIFEQEGVDLSTVMIGHCGDSEDLDFLERVAERGAWLGMDRYGLADYLSTERRNSVLIEMCRRGYTERMLMSQDHVVVYDSEWPRPEMAALRADVSLTYIIERVLPALREAGVTDEQIGTMMVRNPAQWILGAAA